MVIYHEFIKIGHMLAIWNCHHYMTNCLIVVDDYNNKTWQPISIKFPKLHVKLSVEMDLSLADNAVVMAGD